MKLKNKTFSMVLTAIFGAIILFLSLVPNIGYITIVPGVSITIIHIPVLVGIFLLSLSGSIYLGVFFGLGSLMVAFMRAATPVDEAFKNPLVSVLPRILLAIITFYLIKFFKKINIIKPGKIILTVIVSLVTGFGIFFGINEFLRNILADNYMNYRLIINIGIIVLILAMIAFYIYYIIFKSGKNAYIPSVFIISTFIHTILVLSSLLIFKPSAFELMLGENQTVINLILLIALTNGILEVVIATLIGTPIVVAIKKKVDDNDDTTIWYW